MYHQPSKRRQLIQRVVTYGFMSVATVALVTVLVFVMLGYQFNSTDGKVEQGGLVQFDSQPNGANVTIDGTNFGTRTPSKTTMTSGQHFVTMNRSGYNTWQKSVKVIPGSVLWLNYTRLIPTKLSPANIADFPIVSSTAASPDAKWMAIKEDPATPGLHLEDLTRDEVKTTELVLPSDSYTHPTEGKTQSFSIEKWDPDSRYILMKHIYDDGKIEWMVVDSQNATLTKNVTKLLDIDASNIVFDGGNSHIMYAQIGADIRKVDLNAATLSRPLVSNVAEFSIYDRSTIVYSTMLSPDTQKRSVGYYEDGAAQPYTIRTYADDGQKPLHIAIGKYFGDMYEAINYGDTVEVLKGNLPKANTSKSSGLRSIAKMDLVGGAQYLSIMTEGRFVVAQSGATFQVYDLELKKETTTTLKGSSAITSKLNWIDNYMLWSDRDNMLRLYEFDGANQHDIMPVAAGFSVTLSPNAKYIYGVVKSESGMYHLERVRMILP
jgi:hypothetical protein